MEDWIILDDLELSRYSVSDMGRFRNDETERILRTSYNNHGVLRVGLCRDGDNRQMTLGVAATVARYFLGGHSEEFGTPINLDGNRSNNAVTNLAWRPLWFAFQYNRQFFEPPYYFNKPIVNIHTGEKFAQPRDAAIAYGLLEKDIVHDIVNQKGVWPHGYVFDWAE